MIFWIGYEHKTLKEFEKYFGRLIIKYHNRSQNLIQNALNKNNGKMYVGSAYGENMILGRWRNYIKNGHGGNKELKEIDFDYIKQNFRYSILDIFKSTVDDNYIIQRESWWKRVLQTRKFGCNKN
jgi:hypothetical protein